MHAGGRRHRDAQIASQYARGFSLATLGSSYRLSERQLRRIIKEQRKLNPVAFSHSAHENFEEMLDNYNAAISDLAMEAARADTSAKTVAAINARVRLYDKKQRLLDNAGLFPHFEPPTLRDGEALGVAFIKILRHYGVPTEAEDRVYEALEHWINGSLRRFEVPNGDVDGARREPKG
jgi:hypothetical protein